MWIRIRKIYIKCSLMAILSWIPTSELLAENPECPSKSNSLYTSGLLKSVAYGDGKFVLVGTGPGKYGPTGVVFISEDEKTWEHVYTGGGTFRDVTWGEGQFIAVGYGGVDEGDLIIGSKDGHEWNTRFVNRETTISNLALDAVHWTGKTFVAAGSKGILIPDKDGVWDYVVTRDDFPDQPHSTMTLDTVTSNQSSILVGGLLTELYKLEAGKTWKKLSGPGNYKRHFSMIWDGKRFLSTSIRGQIHTSVDGVQWETINTGSKYNLRDIVWTGLHYVVVGECGTILISEDAKTWDSVNPGTSAGLSRIAWGGDRFVVIGNLGWSENIVLTSVNGKTWEQMKIENIQPTFNYNSHIQDGKTRVSHVAHGQLSLE